MPSRLSEVFASLRTARHGGTARPSVGLQWLCSVDVGVASLRDDLFALLG